jgi:XTP/dITP diphosphohydrolase
VASAELLLASSNEGKLAEFRALAAGTSPRIEALPGFERLPSYEEIAPTFAENAAGKALYYSRFSGGLVFADDSGLEAETLRGAPGVQSARYAGAGATNEERITKLLRELAGRPAAERRARFVCVIALARQGHALAVVSDAVEGTLLEAPRGAGGFGYDPLFFYEPLGKTFAELAREEKNRVSHRGRAFRKLLTCISDPRGAEGI